MSRGLPAGCLGPGHCASDPPPVAGVARPVHQDGERLDRQCRHCFGSLTGSDPSSRSSFATPQDLRSVYWTRRTSGLRLILGLRLLCALCGGQLIGRSSHPGQIAVGVQEQHPARLFIEDRFQVRLDFPTRVYAVVRSARNVAALVARSSAVRFSREPASRRACTSFACTCLLCRRRGPWPAQEPRRGTSRRRRTWPLRS